MFIYNKIKFSYYRRRILASQSKIVHYSTFGGDGWHNYHHCFPWDYKVSEFGWGKGISTYLVEFFAYCGLAYDLKTVSLKMVEDHAQKHGDGSLANIK